MSPQFRAFSDMIKSNPCPPDLNDAEYVDWFRNTMRGFGDLVPLTSDCSVQRSQVGSAQGTESYWVVPSGVNNASDAPTILYFHGGGFVAGLSADSLLFRDIDIDMILLCAQIAAGALTASCTCN